jgi:hypothetical protein
MSCVYAEAYLQVLLCFLLNDIKNVRLAFELDQNLIIQKKYKSVL